MAEIHRIQEETHNRTAANVSESTATGHSGTWIGVSLVGLVILISYITLYALYMARV